MDGRDRHDYRESPLDRPTHRPTRSEARPSRYMPHQGNREILRRLRRMLKADQEAAKAWLKDHAMLIDGTYRLVDDRGEDISDPATVEAAVKLLRATTA